MCVSVILISVNTSEENFNEHPDRYDTRARHINRPFRQFVTSKTAKNVHIGRVKFFREIQCPWDKYTDKRAVNCRQTWPNLECLRYALENKLLWGQKKKETCSKTAENGHLECFWFALENGCLWDKYTYFNDTGYGHLVCLRYAPKTNEWNKLFICKRTAQNKYIECA